MSLKNIISLALDRESWSNKADNESVANAKVVFSDHEEKHEHQLHDQTMEESIIHEEKCEKEVVVYEETKIECEYEQNESVETIEVVESQVEEKNSENECQFEVLPPKEIFEDLSKQIKEFQSSSGETLGRETHEIERIAKSELSVRIELNKQSENNGKHLVKENKQGMSEEKNLEIESIIMKDKEMVIHHEYTNFNLYFSSVLKVLLQNSMPYKDLFDDFVEVSYPFKGIYGVFIQRKKNITYSCFKFRRKLHKCNFYKFLNLLE